MTEERIGLQHSVLSSFFITLTNTGHNCITSATNLELTKILVLSAAILNLCKLTQFFHALFDEIEEIFSMDPRLNLILTSKKECIQKLVLKSGQ